MSLLLLLAAVLGGTAATYLYEDDEPLGFRLAAGVPIGLIVLGLAGFVVSWAIGFGITSVVLAAVAVLSPVVALQSPSRRERLRLDLRAVPAALAAAWQSPTLGAVVTLVFYAAMGLLIARVFDRTMFEGPEGGIFTGVDHNLGDLPFHLAIVTSFRYGDNLPPEHPELAGARLTYPFLVDFVAAMLMRAGETLRRALLMENVALGLALVALLHRWSQRLTRDALAALMAPALVLFSGGLGFTLLKGEVDPVGSGLMGALRYPVHDYTILPDGPYRWGNLIITMLMPQRSFLLGMPAFLVLATLLWRAVSERREEAADLARSRRRMLAAGVLAGLLPLAHAHACATAVPVMMTLALLFPDLRGWGRALAVAAVLILPQVLFAAHGTAMRAGSFVAWQVGWDRGALGTTWFWWFNLGFFIPLLLVALGWRGTRAPVDEPLLRFYLPFAMCFVVPNLVRLSPWIWDNIKFLVWWHVASAPLVALVLVRVWRGGAWARVAAVVLFVLLTLSGALDVYRVVSGKIANAVFSPSAVAFAGRIVQTTPPRAMILHAPTYNSEVYLSGRRTVVGYPGHIWSQGLEAGAREEDVRHLYAGAPDARALLAQYAIDFVLVGPRERTLAGLTEGPFRGLEIVAEDREYRLYRAR